MSDIQYEDITIFIDESGTVAKGKVSEDDYFVITLLMVKDKYVRHVSKLFKKYRLQVAKKDEKLYKELTSTQEIKGSELSEKQKKHIYEKICEKCNGEFEIAVISLNNKCAKEKFRSVSSRTFNYLIKLYLENWFKNHSIFKHPRKISFIIDERNVATKSKFTLQEYLNTELNLEKDFVEDDMTVVYEDSKNRLLLQMTDFISNTYYRHIQKQEKYKMCNGNIELLKNHLCNGKIFIYPMHE